MLKRLIPLLAAALLSMMTVAPAFAHVSVEPGEAPASSRQTLTFTVGHDCDGSPTNRVVIRVEAGFSDVVPVDAGGWELAIENDEEGAVIVSWDKLDRAPEEVPPFEIDMTMPDAEGETLYLPVIQGCEQGEYAWIEIPEEGQDPSELESPAPSVVLTAADPDTTTTTASPTTTAAPTTTSAATTTAPPTTTSAATTTTVAPATTAAPTTIAPTTGAPATTSTAAPTTTLVAAAGEDDDGVSPWLWVLGGIAAAGAVGGGIWYARRDTTGGV